MNNPVLNGFNTQELTLTASDDIAVGMAVTIGAYSTALIPASGSLFCGICSDVRGGYASVIMTGYAKVKYSGSTPSLGYNKLAGDGSGKVKVDENGLHVLVTSVNLSTKTLEIIL